ncbi:hypothetical protein C0J52_15059 [Blattella germanica]|nr:hypothetical protein C0J52_15059 [Blattella germanica]
MGKEKEKKILKYEENQMLQALEAVKNVMPIASASKLYKVPKTTLMCKNSGKYPVKRQMGPFCVLGKEYEDILVKWILESQKNGFPISIVQLI